MATARVQAVQCATEDNARRTPTPAMLRRCPDLILQPVVECLAPTVIAVLGHAARQAIERQFPVRLTSLGPVLAAGHLEASGRQVLLVALRHPSSGFGMRSIEALENAITAGDVARMDPRSRLTGIAT
jgi:hypothetical protein